MRDTDTTEGYEHTITVAVDGEENIIFKVVTANESIDLTAVYVTEHPITLTKTQDKEKENENRC